MSLALGLVKSWGGGNPRDFLKSSKAIWHSSIYTKWVMLQRFLKNDRYLFIILEMNLFSATICPVSIRTSLSIMSRLIYVNAFSFSRFSSIPFLLTINLNNFLAFILNTYFAKLGSSYTSSVRRRLLPDLSNIAQIRDF